MKSHRISSLPQLSQTTARGGMPILLASCAAAVLLLVGPAMAQAPATPAIQTTAAQPATAAQPQSAPLVSAPVPADAQASQQASLAGEFASPFSDSNAPDATGQQGAPPQTFTAPAHTQGPHHTLGKTMAIVGTIALGFGTLSYAVADQHCKHFTGICGDMHTGGLATLAGGGAVAAVGFYWEFQKPKQQ
jgi:hypothetical protein